MAGKITIPIDEDRLDEEVERAIDQFSDAVKEYAQDLSQVELDTGGVPLVFFFENFWEKINEKTRELLAQLVEGSIESIDERQLIESKKANI